jgi:acetyl-CoA carboxylase biotin carboxylase subunit
MTHSVPFKKVLIANRGEIAVRIIRACREMGIGTVAIYSEVDRNALHARCAHEAYCLGASSPKESYLNIEKILALAQQARAEAIHPGYGFLSENATFAEVCCRRGFVFIGPTADALRAAGDKILARRTAQACGVPVVPGSVASLNGHDEGAEIARMVGYPVLLKAAAGGGGKGMRIAHNEEELRRAIDTAAREADSAFGNPALYVEKYVNSPRHVEVQLLADHFGNIVHLGERDSTIQRRFQKVIEESPAPAVDDDLRNRITKAAIKVAQTVGYRNAGTVEFLVDGQNFYFIEVNARLQVEHPVTEMVTGIDIVKEQISIAAGCPLRFQQQDISFKGASLQCRIYAENPAYNFMPSPGVISAIKEPAGPNVRVDSGVVAGSTVPIEYDGLLAKVIVWGDTRTKAIDRMKQALDEYEIIGIHTTIPFKRYIMDTELFRCGHFDTSFINHVLQDWKDSRSNARKN